MPLISNEKEETHISRFSQSTQIKLSCVYYVVQYTQEAVSCRLHSTLYT